MGIGAVTRRERRHEHFANPHLHAHLYARDKDDSNPPPELTAPAWDFFKVSKSDCHTGWGKMEDWDLVDVKNLKCESDTNKEVCLCGAQFSLQALVGTPLWICEPCEMWKN